MIHSAYINVMMLDSDRFSLNGVVKVLQNKLPYTVVRHSIKLQGKIDLLISGRDAVSLCAAQHYASCLSPEGQLMMISNTPGQRWHRLPHSLHSSAQWYLHRR